MPLLESFFFFLKEVTCSSAASIIRADRLLELPLSIYFERRKHHIKWQHGQKELIIDAELHQWATISHNPPIPTGGITVHERTGCHHAHCPMQVNVSFCAKGNKEVAVRCCLQSCEQHTAPSYAHCSTHTCVYKLVKEIYSCWKV